jgi:hypothetical protein
MENESEQPTKRQKMENVDKDVSYSFDIKIKKNYDSSQIKNIVGTVKLHGQEVGSLTAYLISRDRQFLSNCDIISQEIHECSSIFFDSRGRIDDECTKYFSPTCSNAAYLHISSVDINDEHRHQSLGLRLLWHMFQHPKVAGQWSIAFMFPFLNQIEDFSKADAVKVSLARYFSRIGFRQVPLMKWWFMEPSHLLIDNFLTKEVSDSIPVHIPIKKIIHGTDELSSKMSNLIRNYLNVRAFEVSLDSLIAQGGDINKSGLLQSAVANNREELIPVLFARGALLNQVDELGNSALHVAALCAFTTETSKYVNMLLSMGASKDLKNKDGKTPLQMLKVGFKESSKISSVMGCKPRIDIDNMMKALTSALKP